MEKGPLVIVIDPDEQLSGVSPDLCAPPGRLAPVQGTTSLEAIMDAESVLRVRNALHGSPEPHHLSLTLEGPGRAGQEAGAELRPTCGGGGVLLVSPPPDAWTAEDAALMVERSLDVAISLRVRPDLSVRYVNAALLDLAGISPDEVRADPSLLRDAVHPADLPRLSAQLRAPDGLSAPVRFRFRHRTKGWRWAELSAKPLLDENGAVVLVEGVGRDVTHRRRLEEQFRLLAERSPEMIFRIRLLPGFGVDFVSSACREMTGQPPEAFYRNPDEGLQHLHPEDRPLFDEFILYPERFNNRPLRLRFCRLDGGACWTEWVGVPIYDDEDRIIAIEGVCRDITESQAQEEALRVMNQKLNLLASVTRHDTLNQLTVLIGALELAGTARESTDLGWFLDRARTAANVIRRLVEFTRDYQEIGQGPPAWVPLAPAIRRAADAFAGSGVSILVPETEVEILVDTLIEKVFFTLIENAQRHGGPSLTEVRFLVEPGPSGSLRVICQDNGMGVSTADRVRIFERGCGKHTGFGLYLAQEILGITGMSIQETGVPGTGARFEIAVPASAFRMPAATAPPLHGDQPC